MRKLKGKCSLQGLQLEGQSWNFNQVYITQSPLLTLRSRDHLIRHSFSISKGGRRTDFGKNNKEHMIILHGEQVKSGGMIYWQQKNGAHGTCKSSLLHCLQRQSMTIS